MKRVNRGFTLIELLTVIAILAIFVLIVVPNVMKLYKNARVKAALTSGESIVRIAHQHYEASIINGEKVTERSVFTYNNGKENNATGKKLLTKGGKPESGIIYISKTGDVAIAIYKNGVCLRKRYEETKITPTDETKEECNLNLSPTITLNEESEVCVRINATYTELGAKAFSNEGNDLTNNITRTITKDGTSVDNIVTTTASTYIVTYEISEDDIVAKTSRTVNVVNPTMNFEYTGSEQIYTVSCSATYKLEVWGAQGGTATQYAKGGSGGYSIGKVNLAKGTQLYVYVGGQGVFYAYITGGGIGGWNGGGRTTNQNASSGGGGSDIRILGNTIYHRLIVAGGGGGSFENNNYNYQYNGGYGGGLNGGSGISAGDYGYGGTQISGGQQGGSKASTAGTFGEGGMGGYNKGTNSNAAGAGGGGWYGGGGGDGQRGAGGSGSGYVWTSNTALNVPAGYLIPSTYYLTEAVTYAGNTSFSKPSGGNETGHTGNGYAKITME